MSHMIAITSGNPEVISSAVELAGLTKSRLTVIEMWREPAFARAASASWYGYPAHLVEDFVNDERAAAEQWLRHIAQSSGSNVALVCREGGTLVQAIRAARSGEFTTMIVSRKCRSWHVLKLAMRRYALELVGV